MASQSFTKNFADRSNDTGFQFEFFCDKCGSGQRSAFKANKLGVAANLIKAAGALFGGSLRSAGRGADHLQSAFRGTAWDDAFQEASEASRGLFKQCTRCGRWVCPEVCWNHARGLCEECAPDLHEHAPAIQARAAIDQANEQARAADQLRDVDLSAEARVHASCAKCQATLAAGARFCAQCGTVVPAAAVAAGPKFCAQCGGALSPGARFCAGCGKPVE